MTVPVPDQLEFISVADGVTRDFPYPKRFLQADEIKVLLRDANGIDTPQFLGQHFSIAGSSWPNGGSVSFYTAPPSGSSVVRYRSTQAKQTVDLENKQRNDAKAVEVQLDRTIMAVQDQGREILSAEKGMAATLLKGEAVRDFAARWASDPENGPKINDGVNPPSQSSYHWARKSAEAEAASETARDIAAGYASDAVSQGNVPIYATIAGMSALEIPIGINTIHVNGVLSPEDGLGGKFCDFDTGNGVTFVSGGDTARNWYRANDSIGAAVWNSGVYRTMRDRATDTYCILDAPGAADPTGNNDSTSSIRAMVSSGATCEITKGSFVQTEEIEFTTRNQKIRGQGMGHGYGNGGLAVFQPRSRIIVTGTGLKRLRTRRLYRANTSDPTDVPLSVAWNIQAAGINIEDLCLWLDCNYADMSPENFGADWDALLFSGTRLGMQLRNVAVLGYARKAGVLIDVSQASAMPRFPDLIGNEFPSENVRHGSDGIHLWNPYIRGGRQGLAILGARPKLGSAGYSDPYYDIVSGGLVTDDRGGFGCSDFAVFGGSIYGPDHHSGRRLKDPELDNGILSLNGMLSEPDDAPCAVHIDGLAGNGANAVWGMRFYGTRFNTREAFRIRLRKAARVWFFGCHSDVASGLTASGGPLTTNDYVTQSYGDLAATTDTMRVSWQGTVQTGRGSLSPHFYGTDLSFHTDQGIIGTDRYLDSKEGVRCTTGHMEVRSAIGSNVFLRSGGVALLTASATSVSFSFPARLPTYTVATVPSPTLGGGHLIHVANEAGGSTPAFSDGSQWRRVHDRSPIS